MSSISSSKRQSEIRLTISLAHFVRYILRLASMVESGKMDGNSSIRWSTERKAVCLPTKTAVRISAIFRDSDN